MWSDLVVSGLSGAIKAGADYISASQDAKSKKAWQKWRNDMLKLSNANNQNAITTNELMTEDRYAEQRWQIRRQTYITAAEAESNAAAQETGGRSVNMTMFDIERNSAFAQSALQNDLEAQYVSFDQQRQNSAFQTAMQTDYTSIPTPSLATAALGFGAKMLTKYNALSGGK
jgi:hypothetical protein